MIESCLLQEKFTDLNFQPFRIRASSLCLASSSDMKSAASIMLEYSDCTNHWHGKKESNKVITEKYVQEQLFYFYPLIREPQRIRQYIMSPEERFLCLTAIYPSHMTEAGYVFKLKHDSTIIELASQKCIFDQDGNPLASQLFKIKFLAEAKQIIPPDCGAAAKLNSEVSDKPQHLPSVAAMQVIWTYRDPKTRRNVEFCLQIPSFPGSRTATVAKSISGSSSRRALMRVCSWRRDQNLTYIERSNIYQEPYCTGKYIDGQ
jgi:hypothetical protein